jgi:hypothetical protein
MGYNSHMAPKEVFLIRVLLLQEGNFWVAQALEYDIAAQGRDLEGARRAFVRTFVAQIDLDIRNKKQPLDGIPPAPDWYFEAYERAEELPEFIRPSVSLPQRPYVAQAVLKDAA